MRLARAGMLIVFLLGLLTVIFSGCGPAPPCETSLVTMDETRLDAETYEQEAAETREQVAELEKKLDQKKKEIEEIKDKPSELDEKVREMKKGSGRE